LICHPRSEVVDIRAESLDSGTDVRAAVKQTLLRLGRIHASLPPASRGRISARCLREILREEYPDDQQPTHREDLVADLCALGASRDQILSSAASKETARGLAQVFAAFRKQDERGLYEIRILSLVRFFAEVLVAVEYQSMWPAMRALGLRASGESGGTCSRFYEPHMSHDAKHLHFAQQNPYLVVKSHSDQLTKLLRQRLIAAGPLGFDPCLKAMSTATQLRRSFYEQFLPLLG
jgi:hypothetical protein